MKVTPPIGIGANVTYLLMEIIKKYFISDVQLYGIVVLYDYPIEGSWNREYVSGIETVLKELSLEHQLVLQWIRLYWRGGKNESRVNEDARNLLHQHMETGAEAFITITKDLDSFLAMKFEIQQYSTQRIRDRMFLFLGDQNVDLDFFQHPALDIYPHHLLVIPSNNSLDLLTQKFVGIENRKLPITLDTFYLMNCTFMLNAVLFPDKLNDLEGRVVTVSAIDYVPYAFIQRKFPTGVLSTEIADGQVGALYSHKADIAVAAIGQWYFDIFESSSPIARSAATLVVPGPRPLSYALTPILPFDLETWLYFFGSLALGTICFYLVKAFSEVLVLKRQNPVISCRKNIKTSFGRTILEVLAVFLQQSVEIGTSKTAVRLVYGIFLLAAIIMENAYSGGLKSLLTVPKLVGKIDTIHDYVETNYAWGAPHESFVLAVRMSQVRDSMLMYKRVQIRSHEDLHNMSFSGKFGVAVERLHSRRITFEDYITLDALDHLSILKDDLFFEYTMAITTRGWPLMERFNKVALESMQHGLFEHWETEITDGYLDFAIERRLRELVAGKTEDPEPEILKVAHTVASNLLFTQNTMFNFLEND